MRHDECDGDVAVEGGAHDGKSTARMSTCWETSAGYADLASTRHSADGDGAKPATLAMRTAWREMRSWLLTFHFRTHLEQVINECQ